MPGSSRSLQLPMAFILYILFILAVSESESHPLTVPVTSAFAMNTNENQEGGRKMRSKKEIYGIVGSGWTSPHWNWGSSIGTGHDCAMICRRRWATKESREKLVGSLLDPNEVSDKIVCDIHLVDGIREPPFEEVKLVLGLAFQRGRWDGSDGGRGGYGDVLAAMADARRYETDDEVANAEVFVKDMMDRFSLISTTSAGEEMKQLESSCNGDVDMLRRKCAGMVLTEMGFIENGI